MNRPASTRSKIISLKARIKGRICSVLAKFGITRIERVFTLTEYPEMRQVSNDVRVELLSADRVLALISAKKIDVAREDVARIENQVAVCFGAFYQNEFAGVGWYALEPYHHSGGLFAYFSSEWVCGYGAYIAPDHRGKGIRKYIVTEALRYAHSIGRKGIIAAINWDNEASIASGVTMGYRPVAYSFWSPRNKKDEDSLYRLRFYDKDFESVSPVTSFAIITPFHSAVLDVAFASKMLDLVIDSGSSEERKPFLKRAKDSLKTLLGLEVSLEDWASRRNLTYVKYRVENIEQVSDVLRRSAAEVLISYAAPLLPESLFGIPRLGTVNLHPSLLPSYRGGRPLFWQTFEGDANGGITLHQVDAGIDRGLIIKQRNIDLTGIYNREILANLAREEASSLLDDFIWNDLVRGEYNSSPQLKESQTRYAKQTTIKQLLHEFPIEEMPTARVYRVSQYLGYWTPILGDVSSHSKWRPFRCVSYSEQPVTDQVGECEQLSRSEFRLIRFDGYLYFRQSNSPREILLFLFKKLRRRSAAVGDIYL